MNGQNTQKKSLKALLGDIIYPNTVTSKRRMDNAPDPGQSSGAELYNPDCAFIVENLRKENEVITHLLERYNKST